MSSNKRRGSKILNNTAGQRVYGTPWLPENQDGLSGLLNGGERSVVDEATQHVIDTVVRSLATAVKTLRLYPPTSPIPRQTAEAAVDALTRFFVGESVLVLTVVRNGFSYAGAPISAPGSAELADMLTGHGIAEVDIMPGVLTDDLIAFLGVILKDPENVRAVGGPGAMLAAIGIETVRVSDVALTVMEADSFAQAEDVDEFLRELASDPDKLALWLSSATTGDPAALAEGLAELSSVVGAGGLENLMTSLTSAFLQQQQDGRDVLLKLAVKNENTSALMSSVLGNLKTGDIATSLAGGLFGKNVLSMSSMLAGLPLGSRVSEVLAEVKPLLAHAGHSARELSYLEHMLEVRERETPEAPITEQRPDYAKVAAIAEVKPEEYERARSEVQSSMARMNATSVATMLQLLDQQSDFDLYCKTLDGLASIMPALFEMRDLALANKVIVELASREARTDNPWPELTARLRETIAKATGPRSMSALLHAVADDPSLASVARDVMRRSGTAGQAAFVREAIGMRDGDGLKLAEEVLGRRIIDLLIAEAPQAQWFSLGAIVGRLAIEGDPRSQSAIEALMKRPDEPSRQEVAKALAAVGSDMALRQIATLMRDPSPEVSIIAIRAAGRSVAPGAANALGKRFDELDCDNKDFLACRDIISALGRSVDPGARAVLERIAARKALIKRGHFAEIGDLAREALAACNKEGGR